MRPMFSPLPLSRPLPRRPSPAPARCSRKRRSRPTICVGRGPAGPGPHSPLPVRLTSMMAKQTESISMASRVPSPYLQHAFGDWPHSPIPVHGRRPAARGGGFGAAACWPVLPRRRLPGCRRQGRRGIHARGPRRASPDRVSDHGRTAPGTPRRGCRRRSFGSRHVGRHRRPARLSDHGRDRSRNAAVTLGRCRLPPPGPAGSSEPARPLHGRP